jgi:hypothetical protein
MTDHFIGFLALKDFKIICLSNNFCLERTWWRLFQKRVMRTKFDIYVFSCKVASTKHVEF